MPEDVHGHVPGYYGQTVRLYSGVGLMARRRPVVPTFCSSVAHLLLLSLLCSVVSSQQGLLHALDEQSFEKGLRSTPWALVLFHTSWSPHSRVLLAEMERVAASFRDRGVLFASVRADDHSELLDRFDIAAFPTLLWFDGSSKWPFYASEAKPHKYDGEKTHEAILTFCERRSGQLRSRGPPSAPSAPSPVEEAEAEAEVEVAANSEAEAEAESATTATHACTQLSAEYQECMRHQPDPVESCGERRRKYVLCMSARFAHPHPDKHETLAREYGRRFA